MYEHFNYGKGGFSGLNLQAFNSILLTLTMEEFEFIHEPLRHVRLFKDLFYLKQIYYNCIPKSSIKHSRYHNLKQNATLLD